MKLLFVCQYYYPEQFRINDITEELVKLGHDVTVLTGLPNYPEGKIHKDYHFFKRRNECINGVNVKRSFLFGRKKGNVNLAANYLSFAFFATLKALFIKKDFDHIIVYQLSPVTMAIPGILLKKITKKPLTIYSFDLWPESIISGGISNKGKVYRLLYKISKYIYKSADQVLISSSMFKGYFEDNFMINENIKHLPIYAESQFDNISFVENGKFDLLFAGNLGEMQSINTIILAANEVKHLTDIIFHIVGGGSLKVKSEELTHKLKLENVIFHGRHDLSKMPEFYSIADAFLVTLKDNVEISRTLPGKVQTYMAAGKPIIGSVNGESKVVINESNCGLCCKAEDYIELGKIISELSANKQKVVEMGNNGKVYYKKNYSKKKFMDDFVGMLLEL